MKRGLFGLLIIGVTVSILSACAQTPDAATSPPAEPAAAAGDACLVYSWIRLIDDPEIVDAHEQCIKQLTTQIAEATDAKTKATLLADRAEAYNSYATSKEIQGVGGVKELYDAALRDYTAILEITPDDAKIRAQRANRYLGLERGAEALEDSKILCTNNPDELDYVLMQGSALSIMEHYKEAIIVFGHGIERTQFCADASALQSKIDNLKAANAPPLSIEQLKQQVRSRPIYAVPTQAVKQLGFPCARYGSNDFGSLVAMKSSFLGHRARAYDKIGKHDLALKDYEYARLLDAHDIGTGHFDLCMHKLRYGLLGLLYSVTEHCRRAFGGNSFIVVNDIESRINVAALMLNDGDLKSACRLAFPFYGPSFPGQDERVTDLQKRIAAAIDAAGISRDQLNCLPLDERRKKRAALENGR